MTVFRNRAVTRSRSAGLTVVEMMIALAVAAILLISAVPSLDHILQRNRIKSAADHLNVSLNLARGEAIKRNSAVRVCPGGEGIWSQGWSVVAGDCDGAIIRQVDARSIHSRVTVAADAAIESWVEFNPTGDSDAVGEFRICHADATVDSRAVHISRIGRVEIVPRNRSDCGTGDEV